MTLLLSPTVTPFDNIQQRVLISQYLAFTIVLGIAVLLAVSNLYFYAPRYRKWVGIAALALGAMGSAICIGAILLTVSNNGAGLGLGVITLFVIEIPVICLGIISIKNRGKAESDRELSKHS
ncbi:MAG TPA: hypothetical protein VJY36_01210 [Candidatus Bathyarchaeia archaeon]|nr:hypothetical protein [Candidatus Bathyarchaeia archaeon]